MKFAILVLVAGLVVISMIGWAITCLLDIHYSEGWLLSATLFYSCCEVGRIITSPRRRLIK